MFDLFTVWSMLLPYAFVWEKCWEFQMISPLKPLGQCCSNFIWSLLRLGERKIAKMVTVHWPRWPPCPYMIKTFKNLLLQNSGCLGVESLHKSSGMGGLPKLLKWWSYFDVDLFTARSSLLPYAFVWAHYILYGKNVENFKHFKRLLLWMLLKFYVEPS